MNGQEEHGGCVREFAISGIYTRGGLSNWSLFFYPKEVVMIDVGAGPSIAAGAMLGAGVQFGVLGYTAAKRIVEEKAPGGGVDLEALRSKLEAKAKQVRTVKDGEIEALQIRLTMMQHHFQISFTDGTTTEYGVKDRHALESAAEALAERFGVRFEVVQSPTFAYLKQKAPFLTK